MERKPVAWSSKVTARTVPGRIAELGGRYLRVVTFVDKVTIHNAIPDRDFTP
jgi:hypothetical protein